MSSDAENLTTYDLKKKPIFKEIDVETGHPEIAVDNLDNKIQDMNYTTSRHGSSITADDVAEGVKNYAESLTATRIDKKYRKHSKEYNIWGFSCLGLTVLFLILMFSSSSYAFLFILFLIATCVLLYLSKPEEREDTIFVKAVGKVYPGTKAREIRDSGKSKAGQTRSSSSTYVSSEMRFSIGGDSEIDIKRVKEDVGIISKYLQKI